MPAFKAVLWDIDGTLLDFLAAEKAAIKTLFARFSLGACTDEMIGVYSAINVRWWEKLERGEADKPAILVGRFREFFTRYGIDPSVAEAFNTAYQTALGDTIVFMPGAKETVSALRGRVLQCAVTNGTKVAQTKKLAASGLGELFDHVFISEDIGFEKPDVRYFERVFSEIAPVRPEETLIVGDSLTSDMRGGVNAGIATCLFDPSGKKDAGSLRIDHRITSVDGVLGILGLD